MAKKINAIVKLQLPAGKATPGPPVGSTLGPHGINIPGFTKEFNEKTRGQEGLIKKALGLESASAVPNKTKVGTLTKAQVKEIAQTKLPDLNATSLESAESMVRGTARSMGILVEE